MKIEKFIKITEDEIKFTGQFPGGAGGSSAKIRGGSTGKMKEWYEDLLLEPINKNEEPEKFQDVINVLQNSLIELPKYGLVSPGSPEWENYVQQINDKIKNTVIFNPQETTAIMHGLLFWIAPLKEMGNRPSGAYTGARNFAAEALRSREEMLTREPLRIIDSINIAGQLFPGKARFPVQAGEPISRKSHEAKVARGEMGNPIAKSNFIIKGVNLSNRTADNLIKIMGENDFLNAVYKKKEKEQSQNYEKEVDEKISNLFKN